MRILHVIHRYPPAIGGSESWCAGVARWQAQHGHEVTVLTLRAVEEDELWDRTGSPGPVAVGAEDRDAGVRVRRCAVETPGAALQKLLHRRGLWAWTGALSPEFCGRLVRLAAASDVVHGHTVPLAHNYLVWLAARVARRPFVLTPHFHAGHPDHEARAVRWLLRRADGVLAVTASEKTALTSRGVSLGRISVVTNAIDFRPTEEPSPRQLGRGALGIPPGAPLLCFVGRKAATKSLDVLFAALPLIRHRPAPVLVLAGPSTSWYRSLRLPPGAIDLPVLSDRAKADLLSASDLFVLPSRNEAFGIVFLEAWAAGTPVVGADIPATREAIADGGTTFRPDDPTDLAATIDTALANPAEMQHQVARGRQRIAAAHTWDRVGPLVEEAYRGALAGRPIIGARPRSDQERIATGS